LFVRNPILCQFIFEIDVEESPRFSIHRHMCRLLLQLVFLLSVASELATRAPVATAFSTTQTTTSCSIFGTRYGGENPFHQYTQRGQELFSTPPPLSSLSEKDDSNYDNYTPAEVTQMKDVIVSLSQESDDQARRLRLKTIMEVGLAGPNGGPKRFATLFERVLTQVGEQVQKEAREKYSERAAASESESPEEGNAETVGEEDESSAKEKPVEKSPEELKLWALVDMMVQSKTMIKKHKF